MKNVLPVIILLVIILIKPFLSIGQNAEEREMSVKNTLCSQYDAGFGMVSINYERKLFSIKETIPCLVSIGTSHTTPGYNSLGYNWYGIPVWVSTFFGQNKSHLETGFGYWWTKSYNNTEFNNDHITENTFLLKAAYRFQKPGASGLNLRLGAEFGFYRTFDTDYRDSDLTGGLFLSVGYSF